MADSGYQTVALRGWPELDRKPRKQRSTHLPRLLLVVDTETRTDAAQALTFGSARLARLRAGRVEPVAEVLFHADDLTDADPAGYATLVDYAAAHGLPLVSRAEFVSGWLFKYCYRQPGTKKGRGDESATLVAFNAPFDLSRLAEDYSDARGDMAGGFSLRMAPLHDGKENTFRPRLLVKHLDSKKALIKWGTTRESGSADAPSDRGQFLDIRTLIWSQTNEAVTLARGCDMFQVEHGKTVVAEHGVITRQYIDYNRRDVLATTELAEKVLKEFSTHPVSLQATKSYSPASIAKAYVRKMGITPMLDRVGVPTDPALLGAVTSTFYGGRAECHIRNTPVPVSVCDFTSMYPTVDILMRVWDLLTFERVEVVDCTDELRCTLDALTVADCLDPALWSGFVGSVQIEPAGDILPVRATYGDIPGQYNVGVNRLHSPRPLWYSVPDVIASTLLTGKPPRVVRAIRFVPAGERLATLNPVKLAGAIPVDPREVDFFQTVVEQRQRLKTQTKKHPDKCPCGFCRAQHFLKVLANSGSYGIYVEMLREDAGEPQELTVHGAWDAAWTTRTTATETAQEFCYPPIGAAITGAARLMLALVERLVTDAGGTWLFADTDSMAIVATKTGGLIPCEGGSHVTPDGRPAVLALSSKQVETIRETLNRLNPYDPGALQPGLFKRESDSWGYAISAKRYVLFDYDSAGHPVIDPKHHKWSEHGLGLYLNPIDPESDDRGWMRQVWQYLLDEAHGLRPALPEWAGRPALTKTVVSSPFVARALRFYNAGKPYAEQVKPFNFVLAVTERNTIGVERPERLLAPYATDPNQWSTCEWKKLYDPESPPVHISTGGQPEPGEITAQSFRKVIDHYRTHPEEKAADSAGNPCRPQTKGVLSRRTVRVARFVHIGKESNRIEDQLNGLTENIGEVVTEYGDGDDLLRQLTTAALADLSSRQVAESVESDVRRIEKLVKEARSAGKREARYNIEPELTGAERAAAIAGYVEELGNEALRRHGQPVRVSQRQVVRFRNGCDTDKPAKAALNRVATRRAAQVLDGIGADDTVAEPLIVLARWRDASMPALDGSRSCAGGCGRAVTGKAAYCSTACRKCAERKRAATRNKMIPADTQTALDKLRRNANKMETPGQRYRDQ